MSDETASPTMSREDRVQQLTEALNLENPEAAPRLEKVVVNVGLGDARENARRLETVQEQLARITGQQPIVTRAHQSVADFGIREGDPTGVKVTLRGQRMKDFVYRLVHLALPMTKEFKGLNPSGFDGQGNFSTGVDEQVVFPEIGYDEDDETFGMDITFVTTADTDEAALRLLASYGLPFRESS